MTVNIFVVETTALARVACATQESGTPLTYFAAAYLSVNHSWISHFVDTAELPRFICRFFRSLDVNSIMEFDLAGKTIGQFFMARGVWQGCPASGFLFAMAFDRWLQDSVIPRDPAALLFLQPSAFKAQGGHCLCVIRQGLFVVDFVILFLCICLWFCPSVPMCCL